MKKINTKLIKISAFILIFIVLVQFCVIVYTALGKYKNLQDMEKLNDFSLVISSVVHNVQQERESAVKYLMNKNQSSKKLYDIDTINTDKAIQKYKIYLKYSHLKFKGFKKDLEQINKDFAILNNERMKIKKYQLNRKQVINFYGQLNKKLLSILHIFVKEATDTKLVKALMGYLAFERLKESIGIERTILSVTFTDNRWDQDLYIKYVSVLTRQHIFIFQSLMMANNSIRVYYHKVMKDELLNKIQTIQKTALYKRENFGISPIYCYNLMTKKILIMKLLDQKYYQRNGIIINSIKKTLFLKVLFNLSLSLLVILFVLYNLSILHKENKNLKNKVIYDSLTGVYTRIFFISEFEIFKSKADRSQRKIAILFIDLDGFKAVNDTLGHEAGDIVLIEVAKRIKSVLRKHDIVSRFGGDEFLIMLDDIKELKVIESIAQKILTEIKKPIITKIRTANVSASIGVSVYPDNAKDIETLLKYADENMYRSKQEGKDRVSLSF